MAQENEPVKMAGVIQIDEKPIQGKRQAKPLFPGGRGRVPVAG